MTGNGVDLSPQSLFVGAAVIISISIIVITVMSAHLGRASLDDRKAMAVWIFVLYLFVFSFAAGVAVNWLIVDTSLISDYNALIASCKAHGVHESATGRHKDALVAFYDLVFGQDRYKAVAHTLGADRPERSASWLGPRHSAVLADPLVLDTIREHVTMARAASDPARVMYETRSLVSYAATTAVAGIGVFLPILVVAWSNARNRLIEQLRSLATLATLKDADEAKVNVAILQTRDDIRALAEFGATWRGHYWSTIGASVFLVSALVLANLNSLPAYSQYVFAVFLVTAAMLFFLWLLALWWIYSVVVLPYVSLDRYADLVVEGIGR